MSISKFYNAHILSSYKWSVFAFCLFLDAECQKLFLQAEAMLELSSKQEESRDIHAALAYCSQAVSYLQKALSLPGISNDTSVHGRMKHNACVLRSRKLHKYILQQQHPGQSSHQIQSSVPRYYFFSYQEFCGIS